MWPARRTNGNARARQTNSYSRGNFLQPRQYCRRLLPSPAAGLARPWAVSRRTPQPTAALPMARIVRSACTSGQSAMQQPQSVYLRGI